MVTKEDYEEGAIVNIKIGLEKEKGLIIERKERQKTKTKSHSMYKIKTMGGNIKWVSESSIYKIEPEQESEKTERPTIILSHVPWPRLILSSKYRQILVQEKSQMHKYKRPAKPSMSAKEIFTYFYNETIKEKPQLTEEIKEAVQGLKELFLHSVHTQILYKQERAYYIANLAMDPSSILDTYGLTHILRMMLSLRQIQAQIRLGKEYMDHAGDYLKLFISFLECKQEMLLPQDNDSRVAE
ncbi:hypothetical protein NEOKW01_2113 [Nematocida sp. AWRm80]|nr:hypothetical protein NEOKW01_2113 [Nematocida sp. AWRm80]